jgi:hypothetical protein
MTFVCGTSDKFVPQPSKEDMLGDLLTGICRFTNDIIRWKEHWMLKKAEDDKQTSSQSPSNKMFDSHDKEKQAPQRSTTPRSSRSLTLHLTRKDWAPI